MENRKLKSIGIGNELLHELIESNSYYVDKTKFIKTIFEENTSNAMFITRPRRFGKTLTMSTFYDFLAFEFDKSGDVSWLENGLKELKSLMIKNYAVNSWSDFLKAYRQLGSFRKCLVVLLRIKFF